MSDERPWRVRYYVNGTVQMTHAMPRRSAVWLAESFRRMGAPAVALPVRNVQTVKPL